MPGAERVVVGALVLVVGVFDVVVGVFDVVVVPPLVAALANAAPPPAIAPVAISAKAARLSLVLMVPPFVGG